MLDADCLSRESGALQAQGKSGAGKASQQQHPTARACTLLAGCHQPSANPVVKLVASGSKTEMKMGKGQWSRRGRAGERGL